MLWCNSKSVVLTFNIFIFPPAAGSAVFFMRRMHVFLGGGCAVLGCECCRWRQGRRFFYARDAAAEVEERSAGGGGAVFGM